MVEHYVKYYYPGSFFSITTDKKLDGRTVDINKIPKDVYAYRLFDIVESKNRAPYERFVSNMVYFGKPYTVEEVKKLFPELETLIFNMEDSSDILGAVHTRVGSWQVYRKGDKVIFEA